VLFIWFVTGKRGALVEMVLEYLDLVR
jgi:hypothetical protein